MRFYCTTTNTRGKTVSAGAHRMQVTHARGWNSGVKIISTGDGPAMESDRFDIVLTGGSNDDSEKKIIGSVIDGQFIPATPPTQPRRREGIFTEAD